MDTSRIYNYLLHAAKHNATLFLTFDDGDRYPLDKVDLCYSIGRDGQHETEPLRVNFDDCLNKSHKRLQALRDGYLKTPGVHWTSTAPTEPVGMDYGVEDISAIWDDDKNYAVYERQV